MPTIAIEDWGGSSDIRIARGDGLKFNEARYIPGGKKKIFVLSDG